MPDFERRSRASFISSNEGGTPASVSRSWMNRKSSNCLRVSIYLSPLAGPGGIRPETNHERTLSVRYVFRNHLIWGEKVERRLKAELKDDTVRPRRGVCRVRRPNQQTVGLGKWSHQGTVLRR